MKLLALIVVIGTVVMCCR